MELCSAVVGTLASQWGAPGSISGQSGGGWVVSFNLCPLSSKKWMGTGCQSGVVSLLLGACDYGVSFQPYPKICHQSFNLSLGGYWLAIVSSEHGELHIQTSITWHQASSGSGVTIFFSSFEGVRVRFLQPNLNLLYYRSSKTSCLNMSKPVRFASSIYVHV